ncbi:hypothetical protein [Streptomyces broussonetiae]|uniref:hypothetical protein n=1 Tax=Streptomyces broussonetiae TaxID=2686304 RepID=UPI0035D56031
MAPRTVVWLNETQHYLGHPQAGWGAQADALALALALAHGHLAQNLAGAPELLRHYEHGAPPTKPLLEAATDARRLGVGPHLPQAFLTDAATGYLTDYDHDHDYDQLSNDWAEDAFAALARPVHGNQAALRRTTPRPSAFRHQPRRLSGDRTGLPPRGLPRSARLYPTPQALPARLLLARCPRSRCTPPR